MNNLKSKSGITLVILMITVLVMFIIAGTTIYIGIREVQSSKENKLLSEVEIVNHAVYEAYLNYVRTKNTSFLVGQPLENSDVANLSSSIGVKFVTIPNNYDDVLKQYYRLTPSDLEDIGIYKSEDVYVVNYLTGEVINETKLKTDSGQVLYMYSNNFSANDVTAF